MNTYKFYAVLGPTMKPKQIHQCLVGNNIKKVTFLQKAEFNRDRDCLSTIISTRAISSRTVSSTMSLHRPNCYNDQVFRKESFFPNVLFAHSCYGMSAQQGFDCLGKHLDYCCHDFAPSLLELVVRRDFLLVSGVVQTRARTPYYRIPALRGLSSWAATAVAGERILFPLMP